MADVPVFAVPGALAVIEAEPNDIAPSQRGNHAPAGSLFITADGRYATMGYVDRNELRTFMLDSGEMLSPDWQRAWFPRWSIVVPAPNGKTQTLSGMGAPVAHRRLYLVQPRRHPSGRNQAAPNQAVPPRRLTTKPFTTRSRPAYTQLTFLQ